MLIGLKNNVNEKLIEQISKIYSVDFGVCTEILNNPLILNSKRPKILLVNLMDVGSNDKKIVAVLDKYFPGLKKIGMHCYKEDKMITSVLEKGFDDYISMFDFSEKISTFLEN